MNVDEGIVIVRMGLRRGGNGLWDVMTSKIVTLEASLLVMLPNWLAANGLENGSVRVAKGHLSVLRHSNHYMLGTVTAAVFFDSEDFTDLAADNWPF